MIINTHYCGQLPCSVCGAGYAPGVATASVGRLSEEDVERIADRVVAKLRQRQWAVT